MKPSNVPDNVKCRLVHCLIGDDIYGLGGTIRYFDNGLCCDERKNRIGARKNICYEHYDWQPIDLIEEQILEVAKPLIALDTKNELSISLRGKVVYPKLITVMDLKPGDRFEFSRNLFYTAVEQYLVEDLPKNHVLVLSDRFHLLTIRKDAPVKLVPKMG